MSQMTLGRKLLISTSAILAMIAALGAWSLWSVNSLRQAVERVAAVTARKSQLAHMIDAAASDMLAAQRGVLLYTYAKAPAEVAKASTSFERAAGNYEGALREIRPLLAREEAKRLTNELETTLSGWRAAMVDLGRLAGAGDADGAIKVGIERCLPMYDAANRDSARLLEIQKEVIEEDRQAAADLSGASLWIAAGLIVLALGAGLAIALVIRRANRDLQRTAVELGESAEQVASASTQVSSSSQALAQGASEQAASIEETSASGEEITSMTRKNADNSRTAAELMGRTSQVIEEANRTLEQMEVSMREINEASDKVGKIIKVIDEIAFQTNILALNAAVEAARAGEAGMGFAVVADEVRNLAQRSAQAAKDTASLIAESIAKSNEGRAKVDQVAVAIRSITETAQKVRTLVDEVKLGSEEQARGIEQISKAISQMEQVTQKAAAGAEETASAGEEMSAQAVTLKSIIGRLHALVGGSNGNGSWRPAVTGRPNEAAQASHRQAQGNMTTNLGALHSVVGPSRGVPGREPVGAGVAKAKTGIPLDDDFKEF